MSTNRYVLDSLAVTPPVDRSVTKLLYISIARYSAEWNSTLHTHPCAEVFSSRMAPAICGPMRRLYPSVQTTSSSSIPILNIPK